MPTEQHWSKFIFIFQLEASFHYETRDTGLVYETVYTCLPV